MTKNELKKTLRLHQDNECFYCGETNPKHLDHVYPVNKQGQDVVCNMVLACQTCNLMKHDYSLEIFREKRAFAQSAISKKLAYNQYIKIREFAVFEKLTNYIFHWEKIGLRTINSDAVWGVSKIESTFNIQKLPEELNVFSLVLRLPASTLGLSIIEKSIFLALIDRLGLDNVCSPSQATLATQIGCNVKSVVRSVKKLKYLDLIATKPRVVDGQKKGNYYTLNLSHLNTFITNP